MENLLKMQYKHKKNTSSYFQATFFLVTIRLTRLPRNIPKTKKLPKIRGVSKICVRVLLFLECSNLSAKTTE